MGALADLLEKVRAETAAQHDAPQMLRALTRLAEDGRRHIYAGTVPPATKARRRAANRVARASRRANRK